MKARKNQQKMDNRTYVKHFSGSDTYAIQKVEAFKKLLV